MKELSHKLKTQDNHCTAKPLMFQIADYKVVSAYEGCGEAFELCTLDGESLGVWNSIDDSFKKEVILHYENWKERTEEELEEFKNDIEAITDDIDYLNHLLKSSNLKLYECNYERVFEEFFLTQEAAERHLKRNIHHYNREKAHVYCNHAWRTPELEKLLEIIEKF